MKQWILLTALCLSLPVMAQEKAAPDPAPDPAPLPIAKEDARREQSIYIPYEKLWKTFEKEGRGVFISYERFRELWDAQAERAPGEPDEERPVDAIISEVDGVASVGKDVVEFEAKITLEILKPGWNEVPLQLHDVALSEATLEGKPARILFDEADGHRLLVEHEGKEPVFKTLQVKFAKTYTKNPGRNEVSFRSPPAPVSKWDVRIPEAGVKVDVYPLLAATDVPAEGEADETRVLAFVGASPNVRIAWTPKAEGAKGLKALATVKAEQLVTIEEGVMRTRATLVYDISRTELSALTLEAPADQKVVNVYDPNVREWSVTEGDGAQRILIELFEPTEGAQSLIVELERFGDETSVDVPVIRAVDVGRQQGAVAVRLGSGLRGEVTTRDGVLQLDAAELPAELKKGKPDFAYRYVTVPFDLSLQVEKIEPRILVDTLVEAFLEPDELALDVFPVFDVQRAGVFELALTVPEGFEVRDVRPQAVSGAVEAQVDRHFVREEEGKPAVLVLALSARAQGRTSVAVRFRRALKEPDLLSPTGKAAVLPVPIPRAVGPHIEQRRGRLVVYGPESLRLTPRDPKGLRPIAYAEAVQNMQTRAAPKTQRPMLSYAYGNDEAGLSLAAERRAPQVTAKQLLTASVEAGVVKYEARFLYEIQYSGVKALRVDVPAELADKIRVVVPGLRRETVEDAEVAEGYVAWRIVGETEFIGEPKFSMVWVDKIEQLDVGKSVEKDVPRLIPQDVDRAWGQIVLAKAEAIDVGPAVPPEGLRPIDPRYDLMPGATATEAAQAFEYHGDWSLRIRATRYEPKEVKATSIERGLLRMVQTRSDVCSVQAIYRVASARQRLAIRLPASVEFDTQPLRINGRPVSLEQGEAGEYFIPLVGVEQGAPFVMELRYLLPDQDWTLSGPEFPREPAMQQVYLSVYVPRELSYLGKVGPWDEEMLWRGKGFELMPVSRRSDSQLIDWVTKGMSVDRDSLNSFATDGRQLCFSTLRPPAGEEGALHVRVIPSWILKSIVLSVILIIGVTLVTRPLRQRLVVIGAWLVGLMIAAVFVPSLVQSLVSNAAMTAGMAVLIVWGLWYLMVQRPKVAPAEERSPPPIPDKEEESEEEQGDA